MDNVVKLLHDDLGWEVHHEENEMAYFRKFALAAVLAVGAITVATTGVALMTSPAQALWKIR